MKPVLVVAAAIVCGAVMTSSGAPASQQSCEGRAYDLPDGHKVVCSATWKLDAVCSGTDMWDSWTVTGRTNPDDAFIRPWLDQPIFVIGFELTKIRNRSLATRLRSWLRLRSWEAWARSFLTSSDEWYMIGSALHPDAMIWLAPGHTTAKHFWPAGTGQPWPAKKDADTTVKYADMIDLHGTCFSGRVSVFVTVYYTPITP